MAVALRKARPADVAQIDALIARSARGLSTADYRASQVEGALRGAFGGDAMAHGFSRVELMATLPGVKLYAARGYLGGPMVHVDVGFGEIIEFVPMRKTLVAP